MTLSVALVTKQYVVVVTDRRITAGSSVISDEREKVCALFCADAKMSVSYSGLAELPSFRTFDWMLGALEKAGPTDFTAAGIASRFAASATEVFANNNAIKRIDAQFRKTSFLFAGFLYRSDGSIPAYAVISNFQRGQPHLVSSASLYSGFQTSLATLGLGQSFQFVWVGDDARLSRENLHSLGVDAHRLRPEIAVLRLVNIVRKSMNQKGPSTIGAQITSMIVLPDSSHSMMTQYHSAIAQPMIYMAAMVFSMAECQVTIRNITIEPVEPNAPPSSFPVVPRNKPCPCKSGRKYKFCHGLRPN